MGFYAPELRKLMAKVERMDGQLSAVFSSTMDKWALDIYRGILKRSPVGAAPKGRSKAGYTGGAFRASWSITDKVTPGFAWGKVISNNQPYAEPVVYGSPVGGAPWPSAGEKTVERDGRVFSSQAPEGVVDPVISEGGVDEVAAELMDVITRMF